MVKNLRSASGKEYGINRLIKGEKQYMDRTYQFNYIPQELLGLPHIKTCGNDKLISKEDKCLSFEVNSNVDIYILFADKFPVKPQWLGQFTQERLNITREDSNADNMKGYFSVFKKSCPKGKVVLNGCSPTKMLKSEKYIETGGENYCMYSVVIKKTE